MSGPEVGSEPGPAALFAELAARIRRRGPVPFSELVEVALYDEVHGFYASGGHAGRRGDFITSPEVGPLFGAVLAAYLDEVWRDLGEPEVFVVVEAGAGVGTLARTVLEARPACLGAVTYVLVEQSAALRARHGDHLDLADPVFALPPSRPDDDERPAVLSGPRFVSLAELPALAFRGVVLANELLDNLAFDVLERGADSWDEVRVGLADGEDALEERRVPAAPEDEGLVAALVPDAPVGARVPVPHGARSWVADALGLVREGRLLVVDYGAGSAELAARGPAGWLRTYRGQQRGGSPLADLGAQDITADVAFDQVTRQHVPSRTWSQAAFLEHHGIGPLVDEGRRVWAERGGVGDLAALKARSRVREAEALLDPDGLGAFSVLEWSRG